MTVFSYSDTMFTQTSSMQVFVHISTFGWGIESKQGQRLRADMSGHHTTGNLPRDAYWQMIYKSECVRVTNTTLIMVEARTTKLRTRGSTAIQMWIRKVAST
jgi:hypothetical protein